MAPGLSHRCPEGHHLGSPSRLWAPWGSRHLPWSALPWESEACPVSPPRASASLLVQRTPVVSLASWSPVCLALLEKAQEYGARGVWAARCWASGSWLWGSPSPAAAPEPCPPPVLREFGREARSGWLPTPHPPAEDIHPAQKARARRQTHLHGPPGFVCRAAGPEAIWGAVVPAGRGPGLPLKVGEAAAAGRPHIWPSVAFLPHSPRVSRARPAWHR